MIGITQKIKAVLAIAGVSVVLGICIWAYSKYSDLSDAYIKLEQQKADLTLANAELNAAMQIMEEVADENITTIDNLIFQHDEALRQNEFLSSELLELSVKQREQEIKLDAYRGRLKDATLKDPEGMSRRFTNATRGLMRDFERATSPDQGSREERVGEPTDNHTNTTGASDTTTTR